MADVERVPAGPAGAVLPDDDALLLLFTAAYEALRGVPRALRESDRIVDDLDLDSLDAYQLVWMVGDELDLPLVDRLGRHLADIRTVGDVISALHGGEDAS